MGKRQAAQIAALEKLLAETEAERDRWKAETLRWRAGTQVLTQAVTPGMHLRRRWVRDHITRRATR